MKKIPTLFQRDWNGPNRSLVLNALNPDAAWVANGEGVATQKFDGTAVLVQAGAAFLRHEMRPGKQVPVGFMPAQDVDPETGKQPGWVPLDRTNPAHKWAAEAIGGCVMLDDGTYELIGPKVQGNPENSTVHTLIRHGIAVISPPPLRDFASLFFWFTKHPVEGIVWHHPDGRMVKIKRRDFGLRWPL